MCYKISLKEEKGKWGVILPSSLSPLVSSCLRSFQPAYMSKICDKLFNLSNICTISATLATVNTDIKVWLSTDSSLLLSTVQFSHVGVSSTVCAMKSFALGLLVLYLTGMYQHKNTIIYQC